jgi:hypothetical protein
MTPITVGSDAKPTPDLVFGINLSLTVRAENGLPEFLQRLLLYPRPVAASHQGQTPVCRT